METSVTEAGLGLAVDEYDLELLILLLSAKIAGMPTMHGLYIWCWDSNHMACAR